MKMESGDWEYSWATQSLEDINIVAWSSRLRVASKADNI
jgi:hypothetical protein